LTLPLAKHKSTSKPGAFNQTTATKMSGKKNTLLSVKNIALTLARICTIGNEIQVAL
jgi:hypothetical protein